MNPKMLIVLLCSMFLLGVGGCSEEKITAPAPAADSVLDQASLQSGTGQTALADPKALVDSKALADVAITAFSAPAVVVQGGVLPLTATVTNLGAGSAAAPFTVRVYEPNSGKILAQATLPYLPAGVSVSGTLNFNVPAKALAAIQAVTPGVYTLYCRHDYPDPYPANDFRTIQVELLPAGEFGTVMVNPDPDALNAPWSVAGPDTFVYDGTGDVTLPGAIPGDYTVAWGVVPGWNAPAGQTLTLAAGGTIAFNGLYVREFGTIVVDPNPDALNAHWELDGPAGLLAGNGDQTLPGQLPGSYTITWLSEGGHVTPAPETSTLVDGQTLVFSGTYVPVGFGETIGFWFDPDATESCAEAAFLAHVPAYIVYSDPSVALIRGFECGIDMGGATSNSIMSVTYPAPAIDVGIVIPPHYNYIVGYNVPLMTTPNTVVATLDIFNLDMGVLTFDLRPSMPSSIPDMPAILLADFSILAVPPGSPTAFVQAPGTCPLKVLPADSIDAVRNLLR